MPVEGRQARAMLPKNNRAQIFDQMRQRLSARAANALDDVEVGSFEELVVMPPVYFSKFRGVGKSTYAEVERELKKLGLRFGIPPRDLPKYLPGISQKELQEHIQKYAYYYGE